MKRKYKFLLTVAAGAVPLSAFAQTEQVRQVTAQDDQMNAMDEIVVTASKREQSLNDVPMSITAVSGNALQQAGISDVSSLASAVPGFTFTKSADATPALSIRGVGFYDNNPAASPTVSVYVDEVPLPFPIMTGGALFDLQRVEVLKGPQGTLFGQNSTGGAINFIAAKPEREAGGQLTVGYGRFDTYEIAGHITGPITDTLSARLAMRYENGDGWQESYTHNARFGVVEKGIGRLLLDWRPTASVRISGGAEYWFDKSEPQAGQLLGLAVQLPGLQDPRLATGDPDGSFGPPAPLVQVYPNAPEKARAADWTPGNYAANNTYYRFSLRGEVDLTDDVTLISTTAHQRFDLDRATDPDGTALEIVRTQQKGRLETFYQELRLAGDADRLLWMFGANYARDKTDIRSRPEFTNWSVPLGRMVQTTLAETRTVAAFGSLEYKVTDRLTVLGSARYTDMRMDYGGCPADAGDGQAADLLNMIRGTTNLVPGGCYSLDDVSGSYDPIFADLDLREDNVSWRVGVNYEPSRDLLLYANVSKGYKTGAFTLATFDLLSQAEPATQESVVAYEVGFKATGKRYQVSAAAFYYDYNDKQILAPFYFGPPFYLLDKLQNIPTSRIVGVEWDAKLYPADGLSLGVSGTYVDAKVTSSFTSTNPLTSDPLELKGLSFPNTPKWQGGADISYRFDIGDDVSATLGADVTYRSSTLGRFGGGDLYRLDAHTLVNLTAGVEFDGGRYAINFWGRNIFNEHYRQSTATFFDTVIAFAGAPANYGVRLKARF